MNKESIPGTITGFTEYIKIAYQKALMNLNAYGISSSKFAIITSFTLTSLQRKRLRQIRTRQRKVTARRATRPATNWKRHGDNF
jgi:hypothetical protein